MKKSKKELKKSDLDLVQRDLAVIFHPCSQMSDYIAQNDDFLAMNLDNKIHKNSQKIQSKDEPKIPLIAIKDGNGAILRDFTGREYIDCVSSWWVNLFGHCEKRIAKALNKQSRRLEHLIFGGFTHEGAVRLSERLLALQAPYAEFSKVFFADNGSSAIEVALKMAFQFCYLRDFGFLDSHFDSNYIQNDSHQVKNFKDKNTKNSLKLSTFNSQNNSNIKQNNSHKRKIRNKFITLKNGYHGETLGALSLGDLGIYKEVYEPLLLSSLAIKAPSGDDFTDSLKELKTLLKEKKDEIVGFICEPLVQCAGEMNMYSAEFLRLAILECKKAGILVIFDEIAVGFGRTGSMFAYEQVGVAPDLLCLSKGISGGFLPLSVVLLPQWLYLAFFAPNTQWQRAFLHSHSYTANALACACANAVLDIFEKDKIIEKNRILSEFIWGEWRSLGELENVKNVRHCGMIFALLVVERSENADLIESKSTKKLKNSQKAQIKKTSRRLGLEVYKAGLKKGLILRPLGNTIYFMPPYVITKKQVRFVCETLREILQNLG